MYHMNSYAITELQRDVERALEALPESEREAKRTKFAVFVVHNKLKPKLAQLPPDLPCVCASLTFMDRTCLRRALYRYYAGEEIEDVW